MRRCFPPSSAEVKNEWRRTSTNPYAFVEWTKKPFLSFTLTGISKLETKKLDHVFVISLHLESNKMRYRHYE